jgi:hypothetical protein
LPKKDLILKVAFAVWFFVLWGVCFEAFLEFYRSTSTHAGSGITVLVGMGYSFLLLFLGGTPLLVYFAKNRVRRKEGIVLLMIFVAATISLAYYLAPFAQASTVNKARVRWYIDDLESEGFNVGYSSCILYVRGASNTMVESYDEIIEIARDSDAEGVTVHGGGEFYFLFFYDPGVEVSALAQGNGYQGFYTFSGA